MSIPKHILRMNRGLSDWSVLIAYRGSLTHGTYSPNSDPLSIDDKDVVSICIPTLDHYFGLNEYGSRGTHEIKQEEWDIVIYTLEKLLYLLVKNNPNVLSLLWLEKNHYIKQTNVSKKLIENKDLFVSKQAYHSFYGYAKSQLHRMTHFKHEGYMGAKRKQLVERFGYDVKNASHLIRLLRMAVEFLNEGHLYVLRKDAQELLEIKRGEWTLEQVKKEAEKWFGLVEVAYVNCKLPKYPDRKKINELAIELFCTHFEIQTNSRESITVFNKFGKVFEKWINPYI